MPNSAQAKKRLRQDAKRNLRNRIVKSEIKTFTKKALEAIESNDRENAVEFTRIAQVKLDKAIKKGTLHRSTVARRKSLLHRRLNQMLDTTS